jgi:hypothetical protein
MNKKTSVVFTSKPMWPNIRVYKIIANNPCPRINDELLLVYRMGHTMRILLCPLVLVVNNDNSVSTNRASSVKSTDETEMLRTFSNRIPIKSVALEN